MDPWTKPNLDIVFWTFAGITELHPVEKEGAVTNLATMIPTGGSLVIDVPTGQGAGAVVGHHHDQDFMELINREHRDVLLRLHPFIPATGAVDTEKLIQIIQTGRHFKLDQHYQYQVDNEKREHRQMLIFNRT